MNKDTLKTLHKLVIERYTQIGSKRISPREESK